VLSAQRSSVERLPFRELERYLRYYNEDRAHTGRWTAGRMPFAVLGKGKMWTD
jgi:hypothetical protein